MHHELVHGHVVRAREAGKSTYVPVWNGSGGVACQGIRHSLGLVAVRRDRVDQHLDVRAVPAAMERIGKHLSDDPIVLGIDRRRPI